MSWVHTPLKCPLKWWCLASYKMMVLLGSWQAIIHVLNYFTFLYLSIFTQGERLALPWALYNSYPGPLFIRIPLGNQNYDLWIGFFHTRLITLYGIKPAILMSLASYSNQFSWLLFTYSKISKWKIIFLSLM